MSGWYASVGRGGVWVGSFAGSSAPDAGWEERCDMAALAGCRLVVCVDALCPGEDPTSDLGLPAFARACLVRKMDWAHCPMLAGDVPGLAAGLVESWSLALPLGAKIWIQSRDPWCGWPLASLLLAAAGHTPSDIPALLVETPRDLPRLEALWLAAVVGERRW